MTNNSTDEGPRALSFGDDTIAKSASDGSPKALSFDDVPPVKAGSSMTSSPKTPAPLQFPESPKNSKPQKTASAPVAAPGALTFPESETKPVVRREAPKAAKSAPAPAPLSFPPEAPKARVTAPRQESRTPAPISFDHLPATPAVKVPVVKPRNFAEPVFENKLSEKEAQALRKAKENFGSLFPAHEGPITNGIRQLLPFDLAVVGQWGASALQKQGDVINQMALITREFRGMEVAEFLQEMIEAPRKMTGGFLGRLINNREKLIKQYRTRAAALDVQLNSLQPKIEDVRNRIKEEGQRIPVLLASLSSAAAVAGEGVDNTLSHCIQQRRTMLHQGSTQLSTIQAQVEEMRRQVVDYQGRLQQVLLVTLPALEMADANGI